MSRISNRFRERGIDRWLLFYFLDRQKRVRELSDSPIHLLLCVADHFEPGNGGASAATAQSRVDAWKERYPKRFASFRDGDGRPPQHTFFYPLEQYNSAHVADLAELCRAGFAEFEIHLHHDNDTAENLRQSLIDYKELVSSRHGLLCRDRTTGELKYGFIHGNWALDNSRPDGRACGINNELDILRETGCYADFTMPSTPSATQTSKINSIYYAVDDPNRPKSHDTGSDVGIAPPPPKSLMLIQGPLLLNWRRRKFGIIPRFENACIQGNQAPSMDRMKLWLAARIRVPARPDWFFVKLHTHGAPEHNQEVLLGDPMVRFHEELARRAENDSSFRFHYVTAREMYNLAKAAEASWKGTVNDARNFELLPNSSYNASTIPSR